MHETEEELEDLQRLLSRSMDMAGAHTRSIFKDEHRLSAYQLAIYFHGIKQAAVATVSSKGDPLVAPVDSVFFHGEFCISTDLTSLRARHLLKRPRLSLTYFENADPVLLVQGVAGFIGRDQSDFEKLDSEWVKTYGQSISKLSETAIFARVKADRMLAYAFHPERFPST